MPQRAELASPCYTWQRPSASSLRRGAWRHKTRSWGAAFRATTQKLSDTHQQSACSLLRRSARPAIYEHVRAVPTELHTCLFPPAEKVIWLLKVDTLNPQARLWSSVIRHITHPAALGCALLGQERHHLSQPSTSSHPVLSNQHSNAVQYPARYATPPHLWL